MIRSILLTLFIVVTFIACSGNSPDQNPAPNQNTGDISFGLVLESGPAKDAHTAVKDSPICTEINTIVVSVRDVNDILTEKQWACAVGSGTIIGITPGPIVLTVKGFHADGTGHKTHFYKSAEYRPVIEAGKKKDMGTISMGLTTDQDDWDADGYTPADGDCNDGDADIHKGLNDDCTDEVDQDCDPTTCVPRVWYYDLDNDGFGNPDPDLSVYRVVRPDGYASNGDDCDDNFESIHPGADEACNGIDDDCDQQVDENVQTVFYHDHDEDGYGNPDDATQACTIPEGFVENKGDCDDANATINPEGTETPYDGIDQDCQDGDLVDVDHDGYAAAIAGGPDLDDNNAAINPGVAEVCFDQIDNNSNGVVDDGCPWNKTFSFYTGLLQANHISSTVIQANGHEGYVIAGNISQSAPPIGIGYVMKVDEEGNQLWFTQVNAYIADIIQAHDGGYILAGSKGDLMKLNEDGSVVEGWEKRFGDYGHGTDYFTDIIQSPDGGYVAVGEFYSESTQSQDLWFLKVDSNGNEIDGFNKMFVFGSDSDDRAIAVDTTREGGYIIAGMQDDSNAWLLKLDDKGNEVWRKDMGNGTSVCSVVQDKDGGYVVAGPAGRLTSDYVVLGDTSGWLLKLDAAGVELWDKGIPDPSRLYLDQLPAALTSLTLANDGQYIVSGNVMDTNGFILKTGADADPTKWLKGPFITEMSQNHIYSVAQSNDQRGYILAGDVTVDTSIGLTELLLIKTDENGDAPELE